MTDASLAGKARTRWLTLGEAAQLLRVDVTTLRGWANTGKIRVFRTPGGHRRFDAADLELLLRASPPRPASSAPPERALPAGAPPSREWLASRVWYARIGESSRKRVGALCAELMRILASIPGGEPVGPPHLDDARRIGTALGREVAGLGLTPAQTTEVFLHFKSHVTEMLATPPRGGFGQIRSLRETDAFLGEVLQAMMEAGDAARTRLEPRG